VRELIVQRSAVIASVVFRSVELLELVCVRRLFGGNRVCSDTRAAIARCLRMRSHIQQYVVPVQVDYGTELSVSNYHASGFGQLCRYV
jgi:hypothetical protein